MPLGRSWLRVARTPRSGGDSSLPTGDAQAAHVLRHASKVEDDDDVREAFDGIESSRKVIAQDDVGLDASQPSGRGCRDVVVHNADGSIGDGFSRDEGFTAGQCTAQAGQQAHESILATRADGMCQSIRMRRTCFSPFPP